MGSGVTMSRAEILSDAAPFFGRREGRPLRTREIVTTSLTSPDSPVPDEGGGVRNPSPTHPAAHPATHPAGARFSTFVIPESPTHPRSTQTLSLSYDAERNPDGSICTRGHCARDLREARTDRPRLVHPGEEETAVRSHDWQARPGKTALYWAQLMGRYDVSRLLLKHHGHGGPRKTIKKTRVKKQTRLRRPS